MDFEKFENYKENLLKQKSEFEEEINKLKKANEELSELIDVTSNVDNYKIEIIKEARKRKEKNLKLFFLGIKNCLCCGHKSSEFKITSGAFHLYSTCTKCHRKNWLVGDNYPCEICEKISFSPLIHHIDGNKKNNSNENLIYICNKCHTLIHSRDCKVKASDEILFKTKQYSKLYNQERDNI